MPGIHTSAFLLSRGYGPCPGPLESTVIAATCPYNIAMSFLVLPDSVPFLEEDGSNWATFATRFREAMLAMNRWGRFDGTAACPTPKNAACPTSVERQAMKEWKCEEGMARGLLSPRLPDCIFVHLINHKMAKA